MKWISNIVTWQFGQNEVPYYLFINLKKVLHRAPLWPHSVPATSRLGLLFLIKIIIKNEDLGSGWTGASLKLQIGINKTSPGSLYWFYFAIFFFSLKIFLIFTWRSGIWKTFYFLFVTQFFPFYLIFLAPAQPVLLRSDTSLLLVSCFASPSVQSDPACPCRIFAFKVLMSVLPPHSGLFNECLGIFSPAVAIIQKPFLLEKFATVLFVVQLAPVKLMVKLCLNFTWSSGQPAVNGSKAASRCTSAIFLL